MTLEHGVLQALRQSDVWQPFAKAGEEPWTLLYQYREGDTWHVLRSCILAPKALRPQVLTDNCWLPDVYLGTPSFEESYNEGHKRHEYFRFGDHTGFEPLVVLQKHFGIRPPMPPQLSEEFRLYHNLWINDNKNGLFKVNYDGSEELAAEIDSNTVRVRTKYIRQFQAGRQLDLLLRVNAVKYVDDPDEVAQLGEVGPSNDRDNLRISVHVSNQVRGRKCPSSHVSGRKLLTAPPQTKAGIWPFDRREETYQEFIIGEDSDGEPIGHTCDPDQLNNYFGKDPDAPHYLTPVYFRREVLKRYHEQPEKYSIGDGRLDCGSLWILALDNDHPDHVMVFLGDLGSYLPESERHYWRAFNVVPTGDPSRTVVRRALLGQWADPEAPDLRFRQTYGRFKTEWRERLGWPLFKDPEPEDAHILQRLRIPLDTSQPEFEGQILGLTKVLVDALDVKAIQKQLPTMVKNEKSIAKLERWMRQECYLSTERDIAFLRRLQRLRSKVAAHRKGSDYKKVLAAEKINDDPIQEVATMFQNAERLLSGLATHIGLALDE